MSERRSFSTYEAKAQFSEVVRMVREGSTVTITYRGEPVAEIRPFEAHEDLTQRVQRMTRDGTLAPPHQMSFHRPSPLAKRPGALARFLDERGR